MKVVFVSELSLTPHPTSDEWVVNAPFIVKVDEREHIVPTGFVTDLASVPKFLPLTKSFLGGQARRSAVVHDHMYVTQAGKEYADSVFLAAMKAEGVNTAVRWLFYAAVHHFGHAIYDGKDATPAVALDE
jgi:hypothetical protein